MLPFDHVELLGAQKQAKKNNPQQSATFRLLQISDEDYSYDPYDAATKLSQNLPKLQKHSNTYSQNNNKQSKSQRQCDSKPLLSGYLGRTQNSLHKESRRYISGEQVCVMKKEKVVNLSNFLLIDNQQAPPLLTSIPKPQLEENIKTQFRAKPPKNIVAFIRRRNLSYLKQQFSSQLEGKRKESPEKKSPQRVLSPSRRIYASCQFKKSDEYASEPKPIVQLYDRPMNVAALMSSTSPSFRDRKISNYLKYRISNRADNLYL